MELKKEKLVMFYSDGKHDKEILWGKKDPIRLEKSSSVDKVSSSLLKADNMNVGGRNKLNGNSKIGRSKVFPEDLAPWRQRILDPGSDIVLRWNKIFLFSCLMALFVDPLYFYLPTVGGEGESSCVNTDFKLRIVVTFFRTIADLFYWLHMLIKFRTAYVAPSSRVFGRGELVMDPKKIARRYIRSDFFIDLIATLPLPQIVIWFIIPATRSSRTDHKNNALALIVLLQYVPRLYLIFPLSSEIIKATGVVTRTAWAGAAYNLLLYMLASHVLGASWYLLSIDRYTSCWKSQCRKENSPVKCLLTYLDCDTFNDGERNAWANGTTVFKNCDPDNDITFKYGIFENAVKKSAVSSKFIEKYLYCLWWGLQQLSSYGQNLSTSTFIGETSFAVLISILGLVLFAHLIGNMQTYLQSLTVRLEEWRLKRRDTEEWMKHRQLPEDLRKRVRRFVQYKWLATRGVNEESILRGLPADLRRDIQCHLCLDLVRRVPFFSQMDDQLLDAICERLVSSLSTEGTYIVREGDPVTEMLFIIRGKLESSTTNGGRTGFFNSIMLKPGDFCGEELLSWALHPKSSLNLPSSTRTVKALNEVEGFALRAEDLKFVANQFRRLHSKRLQHTFRFKNLRCHSIQDMGLSHLIQRSITKKLLPSKPSNIISSSWFLADTTAKSFDLSGGSNGAKINSFDDNDSLKISKSSYHVSSGGFMRGVVFWEPNKPVTIEEFQMPRPKAGEVLIKTKACGVCHSDLHVIKGEIPFPSPCAIGHEITGEVVEHGKLSDRKTIERFPVGSRVVGAFIMPCGNCFYCSKGHDDLCEDFFAYNRSKGTLYDGETRLFLRNSGKPISMCSMGGLAEYCVVPAHGLTILPNSLPYSESAILGCAVFTAYGAMAHAAQVRPGDSVAVIGVGGVGSSCLQIARAFGASDIIAVDVQDEKLEKAKTFGATATINSKIEDPIERIKEITGGRGVDIAVEALGKPLTFSQCTQSVRDGGKAVMIGLAQAGAIGEIDINRLVRRKVQVIGSYGGRARQDLPKLVKLAESGIFNLADAVTRKYGFEEAGKAFQDLNQGKIVSRAVVEIM